MREGVERMESLEFSSLPESLFNNEFSLRDGAQFLEFEGASIAFDFTPSQESCHNLLILVNGYQRDRLDFRAFRKKIEKLSPNTATLALDNRYSGQTKVTHDEPLTMYRMARDVMALAAYFCKILNLNNYSLLGISMGGMIAQTLASGNSNVEKLFLVSTTAGGKGRTWPVDIKDPTKLKYKNPYETFESTKNHMRRYFGQRFLKTSNLLFEMMCKNLVKVNSLSMPDSKNFAENQFNASFNFDGEASLDKIRSKTLVISGDEDQIIPIENSNFLCQNIKNSFFIVYHEVGHLILIEEAEKFVNDVCNFLK